MTNIPEPGYEIIRNIIKDVFPVSDNSFNEIRKIIVFKTISKDDTFIRVNQKNNSEYFILSGFCRSYLLNLEGEEISLSFFKGPTVLSPHITRTKEDVSNMNFQALTELSVAVFDSEQFLNLMIDNIEIRNFANTVLINELFRKIDKEISFVSQTAKERLIEFRKEFALLENLVPHPMIASYLGITNISLSRLRSELLKT